MLRKNSVLFIQPCLAILNITCRLNMTKNSKQWLLVR